jgi:hypothetical protein
MTTPKHYRTEAVDTQPREDAAARASLERIARALLGDGAKLDGVSSRRLVEQIAATQVSATIDVRQKSAAYLQALVDRAASKVGMKTIEAKKRDGILDLIVPSVTEGMFPDVDRLVKNNDKAVKAATDAFKNAAAGKNRALPGDDASAAKARKAIDGADPAEVTDAQDSSVADGRPRSAREL